MRPALALLLCATSSAATGPIGVASRKQLFIDHRFITEARNIRLVSNPPRKMGVVLLPEKPWEAGFLGAYGTVIEDQGQFKMWYQGRPVSHRGESIDSNDRLLYATSTDGIRWERPVLGIVEYEGSRANNITDAAVGSVTVFVDPRAPAAERFKFFNGNSGPPEAHTGDGVHMFSSPDGWRWRRHDPAVLPFHLDTQNQAFYDTRLQRYVAYLRAWAPQRKIARAELDDLMRPWPYRRDVAPNRLWGDRHMPALSFEFPVVLGIDDLDPADSDFYNPAAVQYPWADDAYFMFPSLYRHFPKETATNDGLLDIQMAVSRDGIAWNRIEHTPYLALGMERDPDSNQLYMLAGMLRSGDRILQYYSGYTTSHHGHQEMPEVRGLGRIMLAEQRLDGFVSADAPAEGGEFVTPALEFAGGRLELNLQTSAAGEVLVELRGPSGAALPGYAFADCLPIHANSTARTVAWRGGAQVPPRMAVRIAFRMRSAKLYAFQFR